MRKRNDIRQDFYHHYWSDIVGKLSLLPKLELFFSKNVDIWFFSSYLWQHWNLCTAISAPEALRLCTV